MYWRHQFMFPWHAVSWSSHPNTVYFTRSYLIENFFKCHLFGRFSRQTHERDYRNTDTWEGMRGMTGRTFEIVLIQSAQETMHRFELDLVLYQGLVRCPFLVLAQLLSVSICGNDLHVSLWFRCRFFHALSIHLKNSHLRHIVSGESQQPSPSKKCPPGY